MRESWNGSNPADGIANSNKVKEENESSVPGTHLHYGKD